MKEQWQELKETIIELRDNNGTGTQQEVCKFLDNLMDILEKQITDGWIPVSEKMPPIAQRVLISTANSKVCIARYHSFDKWTFESTGIGYAYNKDSVIAWIPLPQPYKVESEDKE